MLHILHRSVVPLMKRKNLISSFFCSSHVLSNGAYWVAILQNLRIHLANKVVVMHDRTWPTGFDADVAQDLLNMTVADDLADEKVKQSKRDLCNEMLGTFVGDWSSNVICVACSKPGCLRDEACKTSAVDRAVNLLMRSVFTRKAKVPTLSRWWSFRPFAQQVLLGVGVHNLWGKAAPQRAKKAPAPGDLDGNLDPGQAASEQWHVLWGIRVRKTSEFLLQPSTPADIILVMKAMQFSSKVQRLERDLRCVYPYQRLPVNGMGTVRRERVD